MTLKKSNKYSYISGKQVTDVDTGTRYYDFQGMRLPSVTTVLAKTKNQSYLTAWKNKVGASGKTWDGVSRPSNDMYREEFNRIFGVRNDDR